MNSVFHIRSAVDEDIPALSDIIRRSFRDVADRLDLTPQNCPSHPSNCKDSWVRGEMRKGSRYYLLECDTKPVGCVALSGLTPPTCHLERLAVLPQSRRKGFGRSLVHHVLCEAQVLGFSDVVIGIIAEHDALKNWYQQLGFVEKETRNVPKLHFQVTYLCNQLGSE